MATERPWYYTTALTLNDIKQYIHPSADLKKVKDGYVPSYCKLGGHHVVSVIPSTLKSPSTSCETQVHNTDRKKQKPEK